MDYVTGPEMLKAMYDAGGLGILHRFAKWEDQMLWMNGLDITNTPFIFSVGIRNLSESEESIEEAAGFANLAGVCIDVAHGHHTKVAELIKWIKKAEPRLKVIAGNIATAEGAKFLVDAGADTVKVGIGAGAVCTTRTVAGIGVPQLTAIIEVNSANLNVPIIADGGIRNSADLAKALVAGATVVMIGSLIAGANECPSQVVIGQDNRKYRPYRGQSIFGSNGERYVREGIEGYVLEKGPVAEILRGLQAGLKSSMSYTGSQTVTAFKEKGKFTIVSHHTQYENNTRVLQTI